MNQDEQTAVDDLVRQVEEIIGTDLAADRYGYSAAFAVMDWATRASLVAAIQKVKDLPPYGGHDSCFHMVATASCSTPPACPG